MFKRVLVPLDGSAMALQALPYAKVIAKATGAQIELLRAMSGFPRELVGEVSQRYLEAGPAYPPSAEVWTNLQESMRSDAISYLETIAVPLREEGLTVTIAVSENDPEDAIITAADQEAETLIAISTHGRSGIGRWMLGSVTDKVVRHAAHPTLIIRAHEGGAPTTPQLKRVILPLDGSEVSRIALPLAVDLAKSLGIGITVLRSISPMSYGDSFADYAPSMYEDLTAEIEKDVQESLSKEAQVIRGMGIPDVAEHAVDGYAGTAILDATGDEGDNIVVMATHGRSGVGRWVLGSVADRVVRHSPGPVLVVRPPTA